MKKINNNAFTLVELLAVIVMLGMLFLLSYPAVSKYINQTKGTTYETYEKNMSSATANLMTDCLTKNTSDCLPSSKTSKKITLRTLVSSGYSKQLKDPDKDGEYCNVDKSFVVVSTKSSNVADLDYKVCLVCSNYKSGYCDEYTEVGGVCEPEDDKENPTCSGAIGESTTWTNKPRTINVGCEDDCGCTQDSYSKTFSESTTTGEIEVKDIADKKNTCTVNVYVDVDKPTCELQVSGDLNSSGWYTGSTAPVVSFKSKNDTLSGVITYGLGTSKSSYDFNKDTSYTVKNGITTVYGYVQDKAGNVGTCSVQVKWDNLKPVVKDPEYGYQVYPKEDMVSKSGSTISVNNYTSEYGSIHGVYVYMKSGSSGAEVTIKNGATLLVTKTIDRGVTAIKIPFEAGTYNNLSFTFKNSTQLNNVDKIQVLTNGTTGFYTNKDVTLYVTGLDSLSGKGQYSFDNGSTWQDSSSKTYSTNNTNIKIKLKDTAGNISDVKSVSINNIDKTVPTCTNRGDSTIWTKNNRTIYFGCSDSNGTIKSGCRTLENHRDFTTTTKTFSMESYSISDKAGNIVTCPVRSANVYVDKTAPTCSKSGESTTWTNGNRTITYGCSDSDSGCKTSSSSKTYSTSAKTVTLPTYTIEDKVGNRTTCSDIKANVYIDKIAPPAPTFSDIEYDANNDGKYDESSQFHVTNASSTNKSGYFSNYHCSGRERYNINIGNDSLSGIDKVEVYVTTSSCNDSGTYYIVKTGKSGNISTYGWKSLGISKSGTYNSNNVILVHAGNARTYPCYSYTSTFVVKVRSIDKVGNVSSESSFTTSWCV